MAISLDDALANLNASPADTTAMRPMDRYVSEQLGIDVSTVYSIRVGAIGRLRKQVQQSDRGKQASIIVAVYRGNELIERTQNVAPRILGADVKDAIVTVYVPVDDTDVASWTVFEPADGTIARRLEDAGHHNVEKIVVVPEKPADIALDDAAQLFTVPVLAESPRLVIDERIRRMLRLAIATSRAVMLIGPPGTGKTTLLAEAFAEAQTDPVSYGLAAAPQVEPLQVTPEEGWTTRELVGGETVDDHGRLRFRPGHVLDAIGHDRWLVLDEANRADMDRIFGGLLTFLSGNPVTLGRAAGGEDAAEIVLEWSDASTCEVEGGERLASGDGGPIRFLAGRDWRLLGTYNALDAHRVFRFGQALGRRFARVPIPAIGLDAFAEALAPHLDTLTETHPTVDRDRVATVLTGLYAAHLDTPPVVGPALFLAIPSYVASGLSRIHEHVDEPAKTEPEELERLLTEGYLLGAGPLLAQLDPETLDTFHERVVTSGGFIQEDQWTFLSSLLPALS